jgi:hypothetical protein
MKGRSPSRAGEAATGNSTRRALSNAAITSDSNRQPDMAGCAGRNRGTSAGQSDGGGL